MEQIFEKIQKQGYYLIAEIGVNYYDIAKERHITNMEAAKLMCREAKEAGADAVKFQSYKAKTLASKYSPAYWDRTEEPTASQYELFQKFDAFGEEEYCELKKYCDEIEVEFMSTPFDFESADYLDSLMRAYKISSSDMTNLPFIEYICKKGKPILLSVGASEEAEIEAAVELIKKEGNPLILLHCVLEYPTPYEDANLARITALRKKYPELIIGYSDHTRPEESCDVQKTAFALGAKVIEKHFTLNKKLKGNDHYHAMAPEDLKKIKEGLNYIERILGKETLAFCETEQRAKENARRSIVLAHDMKKGEVIRKEDVTFKRPGIGISPAEYNNILGRTINKDLVQDSILTWEDII